MTEGYLQNGSKFVLFAGTGLEEAKVGVQVLSYMKSANQQHLFGWLFTHPHIKEGIEKFNVSINEQNTQPQIRGIKRVKTVSDMGKSLYIQDIQ